MRSGTLAFLAGILLLQFSAEFPSIYLYFALLPLFGVALWCQHRFVWLIFFVLLGFCWALLHAQFRLQQQLIPELIGKDVLVTGWVTGLPKKRQRSASFEFNIEQLQFNERSYPTPGHVKLSWYGSSVPDIKPGEVWQLQLRLKPPHGFINPGGFDYEKWLFQQGIRATGYVRRSENNQLLKSSDNTYTSSIDRFRLTIINHLDRLLEHQANAPLIKALAVGERQSMTVKQWQVLRDTGTAHLMAISGLHIGLVAAIAFWLGRWGWSFAGRACLWLPAQKVGAVSAVIIAALYALLAGWSIPTQRALVMVLVVMAGVLFYRQYATSRVLSIALIAVLLYDPLSVLSAGFWLSFAAVSVIAFAMKGRFSQSRFKQSSFKQFNGFQQWGSVQWAVSMGLLPLMLLLFQQVSVISPLANLWAIPLVSLLIVPLTLLSVISLFIYEPVANGLLWLVINIMDAIWWGLELMAQWPWAVWKSASPPLLSFALAMIGVVLLLLPRGWPNRSLAAIFVLPALFIQIDKPDYATADFTLLDVGQGLAAVIQTKNHVLVFDTGPRYSERFDTGKMVVLPFLQQKGIHKIDSLVVSHADNDHSGGAASILQKMDVEQIFTSAANTISHRSTQTCMAGQNWQWDGVQFEILHPDKSFINNENTKRKTNNQSCVLRVSTGNRSLLLTADIEKEVEAVLVNKYGQQLESDVLVIPHHGSRTSSSGLFLDEVKPKLALLPAGYLNRYRLPNQKVMERYQKRNIPVENTASRGALHLRLTNEQILPITGYRQQAKRYWHYFAVSD